MRPTLLAWHIAGTTIELPTYGVMVMLGFLAGIALVVRDGRARQVPADALLDLSWWILVSGVLGSRVLFVAQNLDQFGALARAGDRWAPLRLWDGGLVFYGGALCATAVTVWFARRRGWRFLELADLFAPGLVLGHVLGRLGCFAAGCCYGKLCPPGGPCVQFPAGSVAAAELGSAPTAPLYPTQLFESAALLALFVLLRLYRRRQPVAAPRGQIFLLYLAGYSILRFVLELYRGDVNRRFLWPLPVPPLARLLGLPPAEPLFFSTSQLVSVLLLLAGLGAMALLRNRAAGDGAAGQA
jgi:phosphatidylglycerol:prolipoprotein diacylglycerol transferase